MAVDANALLYSNLGDLRETSVLLQQLLLTLGDRDAGVLDHPSIVYLGDRARQGTTTFEIPVASLDGIDRMAAVAENADASISALTDSSPSITVARQALYRQMSDLAQLTDTIGLNLNRLAQDMVGGARMRLMEMFASITDGFSTVVGTTTVDLTVTDYFDAQFALTQNSVPGPYACLLYPVQLTDLITSIRAEGGAMQFRDDSSEMLAIKGPGYAGGFLGVDIFASSLVPTANAGADSGGGMWGRGAIGYADMSTQATIEKGEVFFPAGTKIFVGYERDEVGAYTKIVGNYFSGVTEIEDGRGASIITDR